MSSQRGDHDFVSLKAMNSIAEAFKAMPADLPHCIDSFKAMKVLLDVTGPVCDNMSGRVAMVKPQWWSECLERERGNVSYEGWGASGAKIQEEYGFMNGAFKMALGSAAIMTVTAALF